MKGYEKDIIVNDLVAQIDGIHERIIANHSERELSNPKIYSKIIKTIHEAQEPLCDALAKYIATHPAPICVNLPDEMDDVSKESKEMLDDKKR